MVSQEVRESKVPDDVAGAVGIATPAPVASEEKPDGGLVAWIQVAGSFTLFFNCWGIINTFGVFQTYYERELLADESPDAISWIGSTQAFLLLIVGVFTGPLYDTGHFRFLIISGSVLITLGFMLVSISTEYWHFILAQSACIGIGTGCFYIPSLALIPQYFTRNRAAATGVVTSGSSLGGVIYPLVFQRLVGPIGFGWATRVIGFIAMATCAFAVAVLRRRGEPSTRRSLVDLEAFKQAPFPFYCASMFFSNICFFIPIYYLQQYALTHGLEGESIALYLVAILNAASIPGRIVPSAIARKTGPINMMLLMTIVTTIIAFCWIAVDSGAGNIVFAMAYGFASGSVIALPAVVVASLVPDLKLMGTWMGMSSVVNALGSLCGTPISGAILRHSGRYLGVQLFAGIVAALASILLTAVKISKGGLNLRVAL